MVKCVIRYKKLCAGLEVSPYIEMQQPQNMKLPTFVLDIVMDVCSLWQ